MLWKLSLFPLKNYWFIIFGCAADVGFGHRLSSSLGEWGWGAWPSHHGVFSCCRPQAPGRVGFSSRGAQASLPSNGILPSHHHLLWNSCPLDYQGNLRWELFWSFTCCTLTAPWHCSGDLPIFLIIYSDSNPISFSQVTVFCSAGILGSNPLPPPLNLK